MCKTSCFEPKVYRQEHSPLSPASSFSISQQCGALMYFFFFYLTCVLPDLKIFENHQRNKVKEYSVIRADLKCCGVQYLKSVFRFGVSLEGWVESGDGTKWEVPGVGLPGDPLPSVA